MTGFDSAAITGIYAGLLVMIYAVLTARVILRRQARQISLGDGGDPELNRRMRVHGNFAEYIPLSLLVMLLLELAGVATIVLHGLGVVLILGRLVHAKTMMAPGSAGPGRVLGMALSLGVLITGGLMLVWVGLVG